MHADQCQLECISTLGRTVCFQQEEVDSVVLDAPFHKACVQELKFLKHNEVCLVSSLDRNGGLRLWLWGFHAMT